MTMNEYYHMSFGDGIRLRKEVEKFGKLLRKEFVPEYYRHANVYKYLNNIYYIDSIVGIIDII